MEDGTPLARVTGLDHVVLKVADPEASVAWYRRVLGLEPERLEEWRRGEAPFVSVRVDADTVIDLLSGAPDGRNVDHMALVVRDVDLDALAASGLVDVVVPPMRVWGAQGWGTGLYISDPDGHTVELRVYGTG
jgi:catechol 2,3-dioxygenase-like lactoylglutathione lyase family enzyme